MSVGDHIERPSTDGRLARLDGLRGMAVLTVMGLHSMLGVRARSPAAHAMMFVADAGWVGVDLFFVLSGFLITGILIRTRDSPGYFKNFYARRFLRIFPLYYGVLIGVFAVLPAFVSIEALGAQTVFEHQAWFWTYSINVFEALQGGQYFRSAGLWLGHLWSLCIEEHFYLVWPLVVWLASTNALLRISAGIAGGALLLRGALVAAHVDPWIIYTFTPCRIDALAIGSGVAILTDRRRRPAWLRRASLWGVVAATALSVSIVAGTRRTFGPWHWTTQVAGFTAVDLGAASLLVLVLTADAGIVTASLEGVALRTVGKYSYGAYVFHPLLVPAVRRWLPYGALLRVLRYESLALLMPAVVSIGLALASAVASWHLYEKHFLKLKAHFEYGRIPTPATAGAHVDVLEPVARSAPASSPHI